MLIDPAVYRRFKTLIYVGTLGVMTLVLVAGAATRGSRRWIDLGFFRFQPSEFGKVLFTLFLAGFLADRAKRLTTRASPLRAIALAAGPIAARLRPARHRHGARLHGRARRRAVRRRRPLGAPRAIGGGRRCSPCSRPLVAARVRRQRAQAVPGGPAHRLHASGHRPARRDLQLDAVDHGRRLGRPARPRRRRRDADAARLPARARDRLRVRLARRAARLLRRRRSCSSSTCSSSGAASGS